MAQRTEAKTVSEVIERQRQAQATRDAILAEREEEDRRQGITRKEGTIAWRAADVGPHAWKRQKRG